MSPKTTAITPVTGKDRLLAGQAIKAPKKQPPAKPENHHKIVFNISLHLPPYSLSNTQTIQDFSKKMYVKKTKSNLPNPSL